MNGDAARTALRPGEAELGLRRVRVGDMVVRTGRARGDTATLMLHGAAGSWTTWTPLLAASDRAGAPLTDVVIPDLPGWGESTGTVDDVGRLSADLAALVRSLGYARWRIVGHSLGGFIALDLASRERAATVGVGLVSPSGPGVQAVARRPVAGAARVPGFAGMLVAMRVLEALGDSARGLVRGLDRLGLLRPLAAPLFARPRRIDRSVIAALADEIRPGAFRSAVRIAADYDETRWRRIRCPVRSVRGERDVFTGTGESTRLARLVPGFSEVRMRSAGHFAHLEQPEGTLRALALGAPDADPVVWRAYRREPVPGVARPPVEHPAPV
ncbi:alpha/beta fold hydrolase [Microbacterium sp. 18062]|uniref:alpha/beta fold hydrolase n=1 Tax=Microbacterium sp. 18062 TaxID=2681410 RepID=UPI0013585B8F|nr:alpha/beta hydrolase [Microbacterium sp. 18062]